MGAEVLDSIGEAMSGHAWAVLFYSGHGRLLTSDWCFEDTPGEITEHIALEETVGLWERSEIHASKVHELSIAMDGCYSGAWAHKGRLLGEGLHVSILASRGP